MMNNNRGTYDLVEQDRVIAELRKTHTDDDIA